MIDSPNQEPQQAKYCEFPVIQTYNGDTIVHSSSCTKVAQTATKQQGKLTDNQSHLGEGSELGAINIPPPVFFCSIEPSSAAQQKGN